MFRKYTSLALRGLLALTLLVAVDTASTYERVKIGGRYLFSVQASH